MALCRVSSISHILDIKCSSIFKKTNEEILSSFQMFIGRHLSNSTITETDNNEKSSENKDKISVAMKLYMEQAKRYDEKIKKEKLEFERGKMHLANMMNVDYNQMTQMNIDKAIKYLFPSGLYQKRARPMMKPPEMIYPKRKASQFDVSGRPYHSMFYTNKQNYYKALYDMVEELKKLDDMQSSLHVQGIIPDESHVMYSNNSTWMTKTDIENLLDEQLKTNEYAYLIKVMERLLDHPCSNYAKDFIMKYRRLLSFITNNSKTLPIIQDENGRQYVYVKNCSRKRCKGTVKLISDGSGKITINGKGIDFFENFQQREQVLFPFVFVNKINEFDVEANVNEGGPSAQAGLIRWGISWGMRSFVDEETAEKMRIAGLLTKDVRHRERKKPGQEGARRKFTWLKR